MYELPETGYLRASQIHGKPATKKSPAIPAIIPVSRSTFWKLVAQKKFPAPTRLFGPKITAWRIEDVKAYIASMAPQEAPK